MRLVVMSCESSQTVRFRQIHYPGQNKEGNLKYYAPNPEHAEASGRLHVRRRALRTPACSSAV